MEHERVSNGAPPCLAPLGARVRTPPLPSPPPSSGHTHLLVDAQQCALRHAQQQQRRPRTRQLACVLRVQVHPVRRVHGVASLLCKRPPPRHRAGCAAPACAAAAPSAHAAQQSSAPHRSQQADLLLNCGARSRSKANKRGARSLAEQSDQGDVTFVRYNRVYIAAASRHGHARHRVAHHAHPGACAKCAVRRCHARQTSGWCVRNYKAGGQHAMTHMHAWRRGTTCRRAAIDAESVRLGGAGQRGEPPPTAAGEYCTAV